MEDEDENNADQSYTKSTKKPLNSKKEKSKSPTDLWTK